MQPKLKTTPKKTSARELDQFYTNPDYAKSFMSVIDQEIDLDAFDVLLEPSAGTGSFYNLLDEKKRIGLDLEPKTAGVVKKDFFDWMPPKKKRIVTIGNPPFGKSAALAIKFFNRAAEFSEVIAFVIPRTFRKASVINRLDKNFHCVYDETVPDNSFIFNGANYNVPCAAQIWRREKKPRDRIVPFKMEQISHIFELVEPAASDFAIQRVGGRAGLIRTKDRMDFSAESHYFIRAHDTCVLSVFQSVDFDSVKFNTAGNPSVSPGELIQLWIAEAVRQGIPVALKEFKKSKSKKQKS